MPAKIDHAARREALVLAAAELIAAGGLDALTNRALAAHLGSSVTVVTHYFTDKRDLVLCTYETIADIARARIEDAVAASDDPLGTALRENLPMTPETLQEWRVWLAFQGLAVGDAELTAAWAQRAESAAARLARLVRADQRSGRTPSRFDAVTEGRRLLSLVHGMSFQAVVDPARWSTTALEAMVVAELRRLRPPKPRPIRPTTVVRTRLPT